MLTAGASVPLVTGLIGSYVGAVGKAGALARYGVVSMVVNIVLTVPMVLLGSLGVVAATAIGQLVAAVYMLHDVRRSVRRDLPNPLRHVPLLRGVGGGGAHLRPRGRHPALPACRRGRAARGRRPRPCRPRGVRCPRARAPPVLRIVANPRSALSELRNWANSSEEPLTPVGGSDGYQPKHSQVRVASLPEVPSP